MLPISKSHTKVAGKRLSKNLIWNRKCAINQKLVITMSDTKNFASDAADDEDSRVEMPNLNNSSRLFIELSTQRNDDISIMNRCDHKSNNFIESHQSTRRKSTVDMRGKILGSTRRSSNQRKPTDNYTVNLAALLPILIIAICCRLGGPVLCQQSISNQNVGSTPILPTVIVRGFLVSYDLDKLATATGERRPTWTRFESNLACQR